MTLCRSSIITVGILLSPVTAYALPQIDNAIGVPGTAAWNAVCGPLAAAQGKLPRAPTRASQIEACTAAHPQFPNCLQRVTIPVADYPNAVCNDGSPGVFYVRAGSAANVDKWVIHLQGGGACRNAEDCLERWCGIQGDLPYNANKMSTDWNGDGVVNLPLRAATDGMAEANTANNFATWTHVWMNYCSSDSWLGRATVVDYPSATQPGFSLAHRGHTILAAARQMLRKQNPNPAWQTDTDQNVPDLDDATTVYLTGTSAGAKGAIHSADWFLAPLAAATKRLVLDGNLDVSDAVLTSNDIWVDVPAPGVDVEYADHRITSGLADWAGWYTSINAFIDESCRADYAADIDRCLYFSTLLTLTDNFGLPLISTESFIRIDLEDPTNARSWNSVWPTGERLMNTAFGPFTTSFDAMRLARQTLVELYGHPDNNVTGVFGPRCKQHVGLEDTTAFALHRTPDSAIVMGAWAPLGAPRSVYQALWQWFVAPAAANRTLDTGDPVLTFSVGPGC